jgi:hypothetical protein
LTHDDRGLALGLIDHSLALIEKRETIPYEPEMLELIYSGWVSASRRGLKEALKFIRATSESFTQDDLEAMLEILRSESGRKLAAGMTDDLLELFGKAYLNGKALSLSQQLIDVSFTLTDETAVSWLLNHNTYWIGSYFDKNLSGAIAQTVSDGLAQGLGRDDVGKLLKDFFKEYPGVPLKPDAYWNGLAATSMNRTRIFSSVSGYREVGIKEMQILSAGDERVCPICSQLDRKIIPIGRAASQVAQMIATENPEDVKAISPWLTATELEGLDHEQMMNRGVILPPFHSSCFSDDTEVYCSRGWKKFQDLDGTETFLSLQPQTFDLEWLPAVRRIAQPFKGAMVHYSTYSCDIMVTPDHQMFYKKRWDERCGRDMWQFCRADELPPASLLYRSSRWIGEDIPVVEINGLKLPTVDFCRFLALYLTEGNRETRSKVGIKISQHREESKAKMLAALKYLPVPVTEIKNGIRITSAELYEYLGQFGMCFQKFVPEIIKRLRPKYIREFLDYFCLGDGSVNEGGEWNGGKFSDWKTYRTTSPRMADDLTELILKVGKRPSFSIQHTKGVAVKFRNGTYTMNHDLLIVNECSRTQSTLQKMNERVKRVPYDGMVYCVELPKNHTLYVRRNGQSLWAGNCRCDTVAM